jgi:hypothetical protein
MSGCGSNGAVTHVDDLTHATGHTRIMGCHHNRGALADDFVKTVQHGFRRGRIKTSRWFVSENERWSIDQCPRGALTKEMKKISRSRKPMAESR